MLTIEIICRFLVLRETFPFAVALLCDGLVLIYFLSCQDHSHGDGGSCRCLAIPWTRQPSTGARLPPHHQEPHGLPHHERKAATGRVRAAHTLTESSWNHWSLIRFNVSLFSPPFLRLRYCSCEEFAADAQLVFNNCEQFNEDTSEVGMAGHSMRRFFESRWAEFYSNKDK